MGPDHCSKPLTAESLARAEKAEQDGRLALEDDLRCECGARVSACHMPWLDGPKGGRLHPTNHYPHKEPRRPAPGKRGPAKCF